MIALFVSLAWAGPAYDVLVPRDGVSCDALGEATPALRAELFELAQSDVMPPWVPMRAADCLIVRYAADAELVPMITPWLTDPERRGLALVVLDRLASLPEADAIALARTALATDDAKWRARFADKVRRDPRPTVQAVAAP